MRVHGWCESCHRIKPVRVSGVGMAMMMNRGAPTGICDDCEEKKNSRRRG